MNLNSAEYLLLIFQKSEDDQFIFLDMEAGIQNGTEIELKRTGTAAKRGDIFDENEITKINSIDELLNEGQQISLITKNDEFTIIALSLDSFYEYITSNKINSDGIEQIISKISKVCLSKVTDKENVYKVDKIKEKEVVSDDVELEEQESYINEKKFNDKTFSLIEDVNVKDIIDGIKKKIVGQEETIEAVILNLYHNQKLIETGNKSLISTSKTSILIDGPTGTGKTAIIKEAATQFNIPIVITPATDYSASGYKGSDLTDILVRLLDETNGNLEAAQRGIVCLDEIDKLAFKGDRESLEMKKTVQHELLTFISGAEYQIEWRGQKIKFDTTHLTFVCMGAFTNIIESKKALGTYEIKDQDYIDFGLEKEFVGRMGLFLHTNHYLVENFIDILKNSELSPLHSFIVSVKGLGVNSVTYDDNFIQKVAELAYKKGTGARALQNIFNGLKNILLYDIIQNNIKEINLNVELLNKLEKSNVRKV